MSIHGPMPRSAWIFPALSVLLFAGVTAVGYSFAPSAEGWLFAAVLLVILFGTVFAAVHHADVIAIRIGEPFGTLLLTLAAVSEHLLGKGFSALGFLPSVLALARTVLPSICQ